MGTTYSEEFKRAALEKLLNRGGRSQDEIAEELGISKSSAYTWMRESGKLPGQMSKSKSSREWSASIPGIKRQVFSSASISERDSSKFDANSQV